MVKTMESCLGVLTSNDLGVAIESGPSDSERGGTTDLDRAVTFPCSCFLKQTALSLSLSPAPFDLGKHRCHCS